MKLMLEDIAHQHSGELCDRLKAFSSAIDGCRWPDALRHLKSAFQHGLTPKVYQEIIEATNVILARHELELTSHGIFRSFRFWSDAEKISYLKHTGQVVNFLRSALTNNVCIGYGTALGLARSNDLIPHDDDVDLLVSLPRELYENFNNATNTVLNTLSSNADPALNWSASRVDDVIGLIHLRVDGFKIDIFVGLEEDIYFSSFPGPRKKTFIEDLFPSEDRELLGVRLSTPRNLESYLLKIYGPQWMIPNPTWHHNWDKRREEYIDVL